MGHKIPRAARETEGSIVDPYVKVYLASTGLKGSRASQSFQTAAVSDNGFNPTYVRLTPVYPSPTRSPSLQSETTMIAATAASDSEGRVQRRLFPSSRQRQSQRAGACVLVCVCVDVWMCGYGCVVCVAFLPASLRSPSPILLASNDERSHARRTLGKLAG